MINLQCWFQCPFIEMMVDALRGLCLRRGLEDVSGLLSVHLCRAQSFKDVGKRLHHLIVWFGSLRPILYIILFCLSAFLLKFGTFSGPCRAIYSCPFLGNETFFMFIHTCPWKVSILKCFGPGVAYENSTVWNYRVSLVCNRRRRSCYEDGNPLFGGLARE